MNRPAKETTRYAIVESMPEGGVPQRVVVEQQYTLQTQEQAEVDCQVLEQEGIRTFLADEDIRRELALSAWSMHVSSASSAASGRWPSPALANFTALAWR